MITLKHSFDVEADVSTTWEFLQDLTKVAACMPGAHLGATAYLSRRRATTDRRPATDARPIYVVVGAEALASLTGGGPIQE
jgi:hypothetical protein